MTSMERWVCALALWVAPSVALGQTGAEGARRRRLILQAGVLRDQGDHEGALGRLREAAELRISPSLRLFIAQEERSLGQNVEALHDARACAADFERSTALPHRDEFLLECRTMVDELSPGIGRLIVRFATEAPRGATVRVRGQGLPREAWGSPWELVPGPAVVEASAPGREGFSRQVVIDGGSSTTVRVEFSGAVTVTDPRRSALSTQEFSPREPREPSARGSDAGRWALLGAAGALFVGSGVFYAMQGGALGDRDALCFAPTGGCVVPSAEAAEAASEHQDRASTLNTLANVSLGVGVAAALGGIVWWIVDLNSGASVRRAASLPTATVLFGVVSDGAAVGVRGVF